ncbi:MAG: hypothetical protein ACE5JM_03800, partial [Armatimonadota bacterium]
DRLEELGDFDELAGNTGDGLIPNMMHTEPFEMNGKLYFAGQDPFYGNYTFPGMTEQNTRHAGSPLLAYDLKTGAFSNLGIPLPEQNSVFFVTGDARRSVLYLRRGYWEHIWYSLRIGTDGRPIGTPELLPFERHPKLIHVGPDGKLYFALERPIGDDEATAPPPPCDVYRYDPASGRSEVIATIDAAELHGAEFPVTRQRISNYCTWIDGQHGAREIIGMINSVGMLVGIDTRTGQTRKICLWLPETEAYPIHALGGVKAHDGKVYWFRRFTETPFHLSKLLVADVTTGAVTRYGTLLDQRGRRVREVTQMAFGTGGEIFCGGMIYGLPSDPYHMGRGGESYKIDSGLFVVRDLDGRTSGW